MKKVIALTLCTLVAGVSFGQKQEKDKGVYKEYDRNSSYYVNSILKGINDYEKPAKKKKISRRLRIDFSGRNLPTDPSAYKQSWHNNPVSQGNTGTCWCFSTTSFYESEVKRIAGKEVKLAEMYTVYWEYIERAKYFVEKRGKMHLGEGSETNAVARMMSMYGIVPHSEYTGLKAGQKFHSHAKMFDELDAYLKSVKEQNAWNEAEVVATTKAILNHYIGTPPGEFTVDGKTYTPKSYMSDYLQLKTGDYVNLMSLKKSPYYEDAEYKVPDNWWHSSNYKNIPLNDFVNTIKQSIKDGYTISIGGDVSEVGFDSQEQVAVVPTFDIPSEYIDENARQMRFNNKSTTDDHAMHMVGYQDREDGTWFLIKDSGSGSRNCGEGCKKFGYYFFHEDYVKLKMMTVTLHKDAVKKLQKKFKETNP